jgi:8-oxo-dGTP pyrophosphatase MutT (NUDIX family)
MIFEDQYRKKHKKPSSEKVEVRLSAYGILFNGSRDAILMIQQGGVGRWELPGGAVEEGESIVDGIKREFLEEVDRKVTMTNDQPLEVQERWFYEAISGKYYHSVIFHYEVTGGEFADNAADFVSPEEVEKIEFVALSELDEATCQSVHLNVIQLLKER